LGCSEYHIALVHLKKPSTFWVKRRKLL